MQGIIIENISNQYKVKVEETVYKSMARGKLKKDDCSLAVGDFVDIEVTNKEKCEAVIERLEPRKSYIKRPKIANISQIILVISTKNPKPDLLMLDKQIAYAEFLNIKPIIVINKIDLSDSYKEIENIYKKIGYTVLPVSAKENKGIEDLKKILKNNINAFSGNSGVGKSSMINTIFKNNLTEEGNISSKLKRGKNTTTDTKLYEIDKNTFIADTPGFSTFEISEIESKDLDKYFIEFRKFVNECEFIGCSHLKEQNCGIKKAVCKGKISQDRYDRFCKIYEAIKTKEANKW
jgi:ribosome biogenesis GTPase